MKKEDAVKLIHYRLGHAEGLEAVISLELTFQQTLLEGGAELPFFLQRIHEGVMTSNGPTPTPVGMLRELDEVGVWFQQTTDIGWTRLEKNDYATLFTAHGIEAGVPASYAVVGRNIHFFPVPDQAYMFRLGAYFADEVPNTGHENQWLLRYPDLLIGTAGHAVAVGVKDMGAIPLFDMMRKEAIIRMTTDTIAWGEAGMRRAIGE